MNERERETERGRERERERERERCLKAGEELSEPVEISLGKQLHDFSSVGKFKKSQLLNNLCKLNTQKIKKLVLVVGRLGTLGVHNLTSHITQSTR